MKTKGPNEVELVVPQKYSAVPDGARCTRQCPQLRWSTLSPRVWYTCLLFGRFKGVVLDGSCPVRHSKCLRSDRSRRDARRERDFPVWWKMAPAEDRCVLKVPAVFKHAIERCGGDCGRESCMAEHPAGYLVPADRIHVVFIDQNKWLKELDSPARKKEKAG